jgi:hypothetical protein
MTAAGAGTGGVVGRAIIEILPDVKNFANELRRQMHGVSSRMRTLQRDLRPVNNALRFLARNATGIVPGIKLASAAFRALAAETIVGGILALAGAAYQLSGVLLLIPAGAVAGAAAMGALRVGMAGVSDVMKDFLKDPEAFREGLKELSTGAREALGALDRLRPRILAFKNAIQDALFQGLGPVFTSLATNVLPIVQRNFAQLARIFNQGGKDLASFVQKASTLRDLRAISANVVSGFKALLPAIKPASQAILDLVRVGSEFLPQIGKEIEDVTTKFAAFIHNARQTGQLHEWISSGISVMKQLGTAAVDVGVGLHGVFTAAKDAGLGLVDMIERGAAKFREWATSVSGQNQIKHFLDQASQAAQVLAPILQALASTFINHLLPVLTSVGKIIGPSVERFIRGLGEAIDIARPGIEAFARGFSAFIDGLIPALPAIGQLIGAVGRLVGALSAGLGPAIGEIVTAISGALTPVINFLADIISLMPPQFFKVVVALAAVAVAIKGIIAVIRGFAAVGTLLSIPLAAGAGAFTSLSLKANLASLGVRGFLAALGPLGIALAVITLAVTLFGDKIGTAMNKVRDGFDNVMDSISGVPGGMQAVREAQDSMNSSTDASATSTENAATKVDTYKLALQGLRDAQVALQQNTINAANSQIAWHAAITAAKTAAAESTNVVNRNRTAINLNTQAGQQAKQSLVNLAAQTIAYVADQKKAHASTEQLRSITERGRNALVAAARQMGLSKTAANQLADSLLGIKSRDVHVKVTGLGTAIGAVGNLKSHLNSLTDVTVNVGVNYPAGLGLIGNTGAKNTRRARGGPLDPDELALVGEKGPELVAFGRAARVFSNSESQDMLTSRDELSRLNRLTGRSRPTSRRDATTDAAPSVVNVTSSPEIRVFVGDREIRDVVVQVVNARDRQASRIMRAGGGIRVL